MMFNFPFYSYYPNTLYKRNNLSNGSKFYNYMDNNTRQNKDNVVNNYRTITKKDASTPSHTKYAENNKENLDDRNIKNTNYDDKVFEILGIKLHFDDILLICLIFFLYNEGVKDEYLFIALILLLLS